MATESVKILIEAEDKASAQIVAATKKIEGTVKATKDLTKNAKSSTEIFGSLAGALGGTEIGSFANQIGGLTGKLGEFSEIQKAGGAGSLAFKAGLVGVAGVIAFQVGNAIGNVIFQTEKWTEKLKTATEESKRLESVASQLRSERFSEETTDIELIRDPEKKEAAYKSLLATTKQSVVQLEDRVRANKKTVEEWDAAWQITGDRKGFAEQEKQRLADNTAQLRQLQEQEKIIQEILGDEARREKIRQENAAKDADAKYLESLDKQLSMLKAIKEDETGIAALREQAAQATSGLEGTDAAKQAEDKLKQIKALQEQIDLEKQAREEKKAAIKEIADAEFAATMAAEKAFMSERDRLEEQKVLLNQGAEAAHAFRLAKQGLSEEDAKSFAAQQAELDKQKQVQDKMKARESAAPLQAVSSRFLTRGPTDDKMLDIAKTQLKVQQEQLVEMKKKPQAPVVRDLRLVEVG
jgi:hypothetical protein